MNPFQSLRDYEEFIYTLKHVFPVIVRSTLVVIRLGKRSAVLEGELTFTAGYSITVAEQLSTDTGLVQIDFYGYEFWHNADKIAWYDPQPRVPSLGAMTQRSPPPIRIINMCRPTSSTIASPRRE